MKKLLVPCDGSESALRAVRHACNEALARAAVEIHLLHVIEPMTPVTLSEAFSAERLDDRFPPQAAKALEPAIAVLSQAGVPHALHCRFGLPAPEIADLVRSVGCDAVIMGTRGRGAIANLIIGSVATQVVELIDIPVTLVKSDPGASQAVRAVRKILVPLDGSESALRALRHAADRTRDDPAVQLDLLHVLDPTVFRSYIDLPPEQLTRLAPEAFVHVLGPARAILDTDNIQYETHCRVGEPGKQIAQHLAQGGIDAVIMSTRGLGLMGNLVIGSVASRVVHCAQVPVTLVK